MILFSETSELWFNPPNTWLVGVIPEPGTPKSQTRLKRCEFGGSNTFEVVFGCIGSRPSSIPKEGVFLIATHQHVCKSEVFAQPKREDGCCYEHS